MDGRARIRAVGWAGFALLVVVLAIVAFAVGGDDPDPKSIAHCRESTDPSLRFRSLPPGMAAVTLPAETDAELAEMRKSVEDSGGESAARGITRGEENLALAIVLTVGLRQSDRDEFSGGINAELNQVGDVRVRAVNVVNVESAREFTVTDADGKTTVVSAFAGCHALLVFGPDGESTRGIVRALGAAPES